MERAEALLLGSVERELGDLDLRQLPRLTFVQRVYTGMDGVPLDRFPPDVRLAGNVGAYAPFVSEHAVALALDAARELPRADALVRAGTLRPPPDQRLLWGRTAVILGYGEIGRAIADRLAGFEVRVIGLNRTGSMAPGCAAMFAADHLSDAVRMGDFVFDTRPLTRRTRATIDAAVLGSMKSEAVFINVGRAGTVDEGALYRHLLDHTGFRAALDVWWDEDFSGGRIGHRFPFGSLPNVVGTPHCAGFGPGVEEHVLRRAVVNLRRFFSGEPPLYIIDRSEYEEPKTDR
jgi:glycerate dehydrogenase